MGVEYARWQGDSADALGLHFHDEDQLTLVLRGSRLFQVSSAAVHVRARQCLYIPRGWPHRSLPHCDRGTQCLNAYLPVALGARGPVVLNIADEDGDAGPQALLARIACQLPSVDLLQPTDDAVTLPDLQEVRGCIGEIAFRHGVSREAFTRTFSRRIGMPPHAFRIVCRLNHARRRIRSGESLAGLAAELGFADQSHFGRHFRRISA